MSLAIAICHCPRPDGIDTLRPMLASMFARDCMPACPIGVASESDPGSLPFGAVWIGYELNISHPNFYARALIWAANHGDTVLAMEDDCTCADGWLVRGLALYRAAMQNTNHGHVIVSLHDMYSEAQLREQHYPSGIRCGSDSLWDIWSNSRANGAQGMLMPSACARGLAAYMRRVPCMFCGHMGWGTDVDIIEYARVHHQARYLCADPCLLCHAHEMTSSWFPDRPIELARTKRFDYLSREDP